MLVALGAAAFSIQLGNPRAESLAQSGPARAGLEQLEAAGIGAGPLSPFEALGAATRPRCVAVDGVQTAVAWPDAPDLVAVVPTDDGSSAEGRATLDRIRDATAGVTIGGQSAQSADFVDAVYGKFPFVVALIAGAHVPAARARLPLAAPAAEGRAAEPRSRSPPRGA